MIKKTLSSKDDLERALLEVGDALANHVRAYLIGGCVMILYNAKLRRRISTWWCFQPMMQNRWYRHS